MSIAPLVAPLGKIVLKKELYKKTVSIDKD
jgi:hypothetical protein